MRALSGQHLIDDNAERVEVARRTERLAHELLGAHVSRRTDGDARARDAARRVDVAGDAEVEQLDGAARCEHQVLRLEIAVENTERVRAVEAIGNSVQDAESLVDPKWTGASQPLSNRLALDELHGDEKLAIGGAIEIVDLRNARMADLGREQRLAPKAVLRIDVLSDLGVQKLDGCLAAEVDMLREVDGPHAAGTEKAQQPVASGKRLSDTVHDGPAALRKSGPRAAGRRVSSCSTKIRRASAPDSHRDKSTERSPSQRLACFRYKTAGPRAVEPGEGLAVPGALDFDVTGR